MTRQLDKVGGASEENTPLASPRAPREHGTNPTFGCILRITGTVDVSSGKIDSRTGYPVEQTI